MFVQVTAKNVGGVFYETQCSQIKYHMWKHFIVDTCVF